MVFFFITLPYALFFSSLLCPLLLYLFGDALFIALLLIIVLDFLRAIFPCDSFANTVAVDNIAGFNPYGEALFVEDFLTGDIGILSRLWNMVASEGPGMNAAFASLEVLPGDYPAIAEGIMRTKEFLVLF